MSKRLRLLSGLVLLATLAGCTSVPVPPAQRASGVPDPAPFGAFLGRHVDGNGRIDYAAAASDRADLDRFVAAIAEASPDNRPELFPTPSHRLAYWINGYNAWVIAMVLSALPIESVLDAPPRGLRWVDRRAGFFFLSRVVLGGDRMSLYTLENGVVRKRFDEPRVHFALNCASVGCPRLPPEAFVGDRLEEQLARETARFLREERNVAADPARGVLALSSIFDWYEEDFTGWMERNRPGSPATLQGWLLDQSPPEVAAQVAACAACRIEFVDYDWSLNSRATRPR